MNRLAAALLSIALLTCSGADAQIESALLSKVPFNLVSPGGKSLAMGGAFTAIADDATAVLANPAGLGLLSSVEAGVSFKRFDDVIGLVTARATATGSLTAPYGAFRAVNSDLGGTRSAIEFAGVVVPVSRRFVLALGYVENLGFEGDPGADGYTYIELRDNRAGSPSTRRDFLYEYRELGTVSLSNQLMALSCGYRVNERLRVGAGVTANRSRLSLGGDAGGPHRIVNRAFLTATDIQTFTVSMDVSGVEGTALGFVVGFHADLLPASQLTVGGAFRWSSGTSGVLELGRDVPLPLASQVRRPFTFRVPKDASLGLAWQPVPGLTVAAEGQWIAYGDTIDAELPIVSYRGLVGPYPGFPQSDVLATFQPAGDVVVPRIGIEYVASADLLRLAFRLGYHREPARGVTADLVVRDASGTAFDLNDPPFSEAVRTVFDGGRPDDRISGGLGATLGKGVSLDIAFESGRSSRLLSASFFYRF